MPELARLVEILCVTEESSMSGSCLVEFCSGDAEVVGQLVAEEGRICWGTARSQSVRIGDIFAQECGIGRDDLEEAFAAAQKTNRPFGEELVRRGMAKDEDLQRCLRRQTVAAVLAIWQAWSGDSWSRREMPESMYDPAFTVSALDLLARCVAELPEGTVQAPSPSLVPLADRSAAAVCLREDPSAEFPFFPVVWFGLDALLIHDLQVLGRQAKSVARPVALAAGAIYPHAVLVHLNGAGVVCAVDGRDLWVFEVSDRAQYGEIMAHLQAVARARRDNEQGASPASA